MTIINDPKCHSMPRNRWIDRKSKPLADVAQFAGAKWLDWSIHISEQYKYVYFDNPKVASGTLKWTLSKLENPDFEATAGSVHDALTHGKR